MFYYVPYPNPHFKSSRFTQIHSPHLNVKSVYATLYIYRDSEFSIMFPTQIHPIKYSRFTQIHSPHVNVYSMYVTLYIYIDSDCSIMFPSQIHLSNIHVLPKSTRHMLICTVCMRRYI